MQKRGKIQITLQSDLCVASGYSYDGIIDTDICYDALGIPYIPAKRLKGCFKETAESILYSILTDEDRERIFGKRGEQFAKGIILGNAYIQNYEKIREELDSFMESQSESSVVSAQKILEQFTHVQAQTAIGYKSESQKTEIEYDGSAKDNSLRYTRVVNQYSPIDGKCLVFEAEIQYNGADEDKIKMILSGTRNIGLKRNRGLGSVKCLLKDITEVETMTAVLNGGDASEKVCISYVLTNVEPLVLSDKDDQKTLDYIKGQTMIGALASKYLQVTGHSAEDDVFKDLFLNGNTIVTDVMPFKNGKTYYPAPLFINQLKKTKDIVNAIFVDGEKTKDGNLPKKLKGKYVYATHDFRKVDILEVNKQICYHHSRKSKKNAEEEDLLFAFEVIRENQEFAGQIILPKKYENLVKELMTFDTINIGKSKSAQYGACQIQIVDSTSDEQRTFSKGDVIAVTLQSDMILHNGVDYTVFHDDVREMIAKELGVSYEREAKENDFAILSTKEITGYLSVWNMRKTPVPAVAAGSMISYKLTKDFQASKLFCGERCLEGFGNVRIDCLDAKFDRLEKMKVDTEKKNAVVEITKPLFWKIFLHDMEMELVLEGINKNKFGLNQSKIGRVTLMLKESLDENRGDYQKAFKAFEDRIDSIKSKDEKDIINKKIVGEIFQMENGKKKLKVDTNKLLVWNKLKEVGFSEEECIQMLNSLWGRYVLAILVNQKYENKN